MIKNNPTKNHDADLTNLYCRFIKMKRIDIIAQTAVLIIGTNRVNVSPLTVGLNSNPLYPIDKDEAGCKKNIMAATNVAAIIAVASHRDCNAFSNLLL